MQHRHFRTALLAASLASAFVALAVVSFQKSFTASHAQLSGGGTYLIDDTDPRFSKGGYWFPFFLNYAYNGQMKIGRKTTNPRARWLYSELRAGTYEVWVTWVPHGTFASNAPFTVRVSGQVEPRTVLIDQRRMPEQQMGNTRWQSLGIHSVSEGTLEVILTDQGIDNWFIVADAVRIVRQTDTPPPISSASSSSSSSSQHYEYFCNGTWQSTPCSSSSSSQSSATRSDLILREPAVQPVNPVAGQSFTITWTLANNGNTSVNGVELRTNPTAQGVNFIGGDGRCQMNNGIIRCNVGTLGANASTSLVIGYTIALGFCPATAQFAAEAFMTSLDADGSNNRRDIAVDIGCAHSSVSSNAMSSSPGSVSSSISSASSLTSAGWQGCGNDICGAFIVNNQCINSGHIDCNAPGGGMTSGTPTGQSCGVPGCTGQCFRCPTVSSSSVSSPSSSGGSSPRSSASMSSSQSFHSENWQGCVTGDMCGASISNGQCRVNGHVDCMGPGGMTPGTPTGQSCGVPGCTGQCFRCPTVSSSSSVSSTAPGTDLSVSAPAIQPATLQPGRSNTITWPVTNSGTPVANVQLAATIPQGVMFNGGDGRCLRNGTQVICTIAQMAAVQTVPLLLGFTLEQGMSCGGSVLFSATVSSGKQDVNPGNNTAEVTVQKECNSTDLSVSTHTMDPENVPYGGASTFRWKMKNNGEQTATNAALNLTIPQGFSFFGGNASCQIMGTNRIQCLKTTLAPGEEIEYAIGIRFPGGSTGNSIFRLYVAADQADPNALNNIWNGQVQTSMTVIQQ